MWILGLTGSIGMGKSGTAGLFRAMGVPVHDADASVHALYRGRAVEPVEAVFPGVTRDGAIDRAALGARVLADPEAMKRLETIVHPLVRAEEEAFLAKARGAGARLVVLDIPLLFETGGAGRVDAVAVVSASKAVQRARVLERGRHDGRKIRDHCGQADAGRRKASPPRILSSTPAGVSRRRPIRWPAS